MKNSIILAKHFWLPLLVGVFMLPVPLLRDLHIESALLISLIGCFWAAWKGCVPSPLRDGRRILFILQTLYIIGLPLFLFAVLTGCLSLHGLGFWILYPIPTVFLGYSAGRLLRIWDISYRRFIVSVILLFIAIGVLLYEFFNFPQVYFFNHVWGGWPGPIYDETVKVSWSLVFYRGITLAWAGLLWWLPEFGRTLKSTAFIIGCGIFLIVAYTHLAEMGIIRPRSYLQQQLGGLAETPHFAIYYDEEHYRDDKIEFIAQKHEFYFEQISQRLEISWPESKDKIESYLYAHPWQKKKLVGAKFTSYVPVWLEQDQLHIARQQINNSLKHELVHVLAKQFGNKVLNASWSIGLIEGLAVAVAPTESGASTINQMVVSEKPYPSPVEMKHALSPFGFYGGRSGVNYTQSGSFVQYLLKNYPVENFKEAYPGGQISRFYKKPFACLVQEWHSALDTILVDAIDRRIAERLYGFPSLFEQKCPHVQSSFAQTWDQYKFLMVEGDTLKAIQYLDEAKKQAPLNPYVRNEWAFINLKKGNINKVRRQASIENRTIDGLLLYADAFALEGDMNIADKYVLEAARVLKEEPDTLFQVALQTRLNAKQWRYYREIIYKQSRIPDSTFSKLEHRTQVRAIQQAIDHTQVRRMIRYGGLLANDPKNPLYFDVYIRLIEQLAFYDEMKLADKWLKNISRLSLRKRYRERLSETKKWMEYLQKQ